MTDGLRIAHLRIAPQWAILRWAILTFTKLRLQAGLGSVVSQTVIDLRNTIKRFVSLFRSEKYSPDSE